MEPTCSSTLILAITIPLLIFFIITTVIASYLLIRSRRKNKLQLDVEEFFAGRPEVNDCLDKTQLGLNEHVDSHPYNRERYELAPSQFKIEMNSLIGQTDSGRVRRGMLTRDNAEIPVAVKMSHVRGLLDNSFEERRVMMNLLGEIKILSYLSSHKHVVNLEGAYTEEVREGKLYVFLELCELGSLQNYLRKCKPEEMDIYTYENSDEGEIMASNNLSTELSNDLLRWSGEIALGMEYLASKKVVHIDIATRNILLSSSKCAKISDFGLSRRLYDYTNYVKKSQEPLPWRWMSPESLRRSDFNEKTDVWSFGVTLWEMYTLGDQPYEGLSWQVDFSSRLEKGLRLPKPKYDNKDMYDQVMKLCWNINPSERPTFAELSSTINGSIDESTQ